MSIGGKTIPPNVERVDGMRSTTLFILLVEKDSIFSLLAQDRFYRKYPCIIVGAREKPDVTSRQFLEVAELLRNKKYCLIGGGDWIYVGAHVTKFLVVLMPVLVKGLGELQRMGLRFCTEDGNIGCFAPLPKCLSIKLRSLQIKLLTEIPHIHGNSKTYNMLPFECQAKLAKDLEMTPSQIISVWDDTVLDTLFL
ncbi:hypothetical protein Tco_1166441 [Tanacetum coccineum]